MKNIARRFPGLNYYSFWGEWPSGLRRCKWIRRFTVQTPLGARPGLGTQCCYEVPCDLRVKNGKAQ